MSSVERPKMKGQKRPFLTLFSTPFLALKPQHLVVYRLFFLSKPQNVIIITTSICVEWVKRMPKGYGYPLAGGHIFQYVI